MDESPSLPAGGLSCTARVSALRRSFAGQLCQHQRAFPL